MGKKLWDLEIIAGKFGRFKELEYLCTQDTICEAMTAFL